MGFLKVLQKAGLVQLDDQSAVPVDTVLSSNLVVEPIAAPSPAVEVLPAAACAVEEQRSFEALYQEQAVPPSPFTAEKLLKLLDGLRAMEPAVRKAAIQAMDAADDAWTVDDAVLDAQRKIAALQRSQAYLAQQTSSAQAHAQQQLAQREQQYESAIEAIKRQITELDALREREVEKATADRAAIAAKAQAVEEASLRESARLQAELVRLQQIIEIFATPAVPNSSAAT